MNRLLPIQDHRFGRLLYVYDFDFPAEENYAIPSKKKLEGRKILSDQLPDSQNDSPNVAKISRMLSTYSKPQVQELG